MTATRSPGCSDDTRSPTSSTTPPNSWPQRPGWCGGAAWFQRARRSFDCVQMPSNQCFSLKQTPTQPVRRSTCSGPGPDGGGMSWAVTRPGRSRIRARMSYLRVSRRQASACSHRTRNRLAGCEQPFLRESQRRGDRLCVNPHEPTMPLRYHTVHDDGVDV